MKRNQHVYMIIFTKLLLVEDIFDTYREETVYGQHNYIITLEKVKAEAMHLRKYSLRPY